MIDRSIIGHRWPSWEVDIEEGRLRLLAKSIGETRPIYIDRDAARAAGYRTILAPPTFAFCLLADSPIGPGYLADISIPIAQVLHGEQRLEMHRVMCAGDRVRVTRHVDGVFEKKGGALLFVALGFEVHDSASGELMVSGRQLMIRRERT